MTAFSGTVKAIMIAKLALKHYGDCRAYPIMEWAFKRYGIPNPEAYYIQIDILNGAI